MKKKAIDKINIQTEESHYIYEFFNSVRYIKYPFNRFEYDGDDKEIKDKLFSPTIYALNTRIQRVVISSIKHYESIDYHCGCDKCGNASADTKVASKSYIIDVSEIKKGLCRELCPNCNKALQPIFENEISCNCYGMKDIK